MKKSLLLLLFILSPLVLAQAQYLRLGAKVGGNLSRVQGSDGSSATTESLAGFNSSLIASYEFASRLALQAELQYVQKGFTYDKFPNGPDEVLIDDQRLHYLILPVMLKLQKGGLFVEGGPYLGRLVGKTTDVKRVDRRTADDPNPVILGDYPLHVRDFERWDYGYTVGVGLALDNGFLVSLHNSGGLTSFSKKLDQKNFGYFLNIGYLLRPRLP